jgi:tetratricopeptide (TPR) repeat protein
MSELPGVPSPLTFSADPKLDTSLQKGWDAFSQALVAAGPSRGAKWFARRAEDPDLAETVEPMLETLADTLTGEEALEALFALAEVAGEVEDDLLADTIWEGGLAVALDLGDPDAALEATSRLAELAERLGDPLAAAEYYIGFLNWRRQPGHSSDPEAVEQAFDEISRLADEDGARKEAAIWRYRQAIYSRLVEADDERAVEGEWDDSGIPWAGWS